MRVCFILNEILGKIQHKVSLPFSPGKRLALGMATGSGEVLPRCALPLRFCLPAFVVAVPSPDRPASSLPPDAAQLCAPWCLLLCSVFRKLFMCLHLCASRRKDGGVKPAPSAPMTMSYTCLFLKLWSGVRRAQHE